MTNEQSSLFDITPTVKQKNAGRSGPAEPGRKQAPTVRQGLAERPTWSAYKGKHASCGEGVRLTHEAKQRPEFVAYAHMAPALYRRTYRGEEHLLCTNCARRLREADGMGSLPSRVKK